MTSSDLKIVACITMVLDHIGVLLFPEFIILRIIGRVSFPIFCFLLVEGYFHTSNIKKYLIRLALFALISEIPFDLAFTNTLFYLKHQNVFFTLFFGMLSIHLYDNYKKNNPFSFIYILLFIVINYFFYSDYGAIGIIMIFGFYLLRGKFVRLTLFVMTLVIVTFFWQLLSAKYMLSSVLVQLFQIGSLPLIYFYTGSRGLKIKKFFYGFYPIHLLILYNIK